MDSHPKRIKRINYRPFLLFVWNYMMYKDLRAWYLGHERVYTSNVIPQPVILHPNSIYLLLAYRAFYNPMLSWYMISCQKATLRPRQFLWWCWLALNMQRCLLGSNISFSSHAKKSTSRENKFRQAVFFNHVYRGICQHHVKFIHLPTIAGRAIKKR